MYDTKGNKRKSQSMQWISLNYCVWSILVNTANGVINIGKLTLIIITWHLLHMDLDNGSDRDE